MKHVTKISNKNYGIDDLLTIEGFDDIIDMLEANKDDGSVPCICEYCGTIEYWEQDTRNAVCLECGRRTVQSCFVLAGIM